MKAKQIKLLKKQIARLDDKDFNLDVWKKSTIILLERIFGKNSTEIKQIKEISQDMSSWSLRDNLGDSSSDRSNLLGKQILETCIDELELTEELDESEDAGNKKLNLLKNELKGSQYENIRKILDKNMNEDQKLEELTKSLEKIDKEDLTDLIAKLILQ